MQCERAQFLLPKLKGNQQYPQLAQNTNLFLLFIQVTQTSRKSVTMNTLYFKCARWRDRVHVHDSYVSLHSYI